MKLVAVLLLQLVIFNGYSQNTVQLSGQEQDQINLKNYLYHFEDKSDTLSVAEIIAKDWQLIEGIPAFSNNKHIQWFKFELHNTGSSAIEKVLYIPYNHIRKIDVYTTTVNQQTVLLYETGSERPVSSKPMDRLGYGLPLTISANHISTYYVRMDHRFRPLRATSFLLNPDRAIEIQNRTERTTWMWRGVFFFATIMALILYAFIRNNIFLYYFLLNIGLGLFIGAHIGDLSFFINADPKSYATLFDYLGAFLINLSFPLFLNSLVPIAKRSPRHWKILKIIILGIGIVALFNVFTPLRASIFTYWSHFYIMISTAIVLISQLFLLGSFIREKDKSSIFLFVIYSFFIFSSFLNIILPNMGLVEDTPYGYETLFIGSFVEIFAFLILMGRETFSIYKDRANLLEKQKKHQQEMLISMVNSQEQERNRVGRELHDLIGANMAVIKQRITTKQGELYQVINDTIEKVRTLSHGLVSPMVKDNDFLYEIQEMCHMFSTDKIKINYIVHEWPKIINEQVTHNLYRICQELLHNATKHSQASQVVLQLIGNKDKSITLVYEDNGIGFSKFESKQSGIGINNIKNRVHLINGTLNIDSSVGNGVTFIIEISSEKIESQML